MRTFLLMSLLATSAAIYAQAPAPAPRTNAAPPPQTPAPAPAQPRPARPARPRAATPAPRGGIAMLVTDTAGMILEGVHVELSGPAMRMGDTDQSGQLNFPGLDPGTYRLVFTGNTVRGFERELTLKAGEISRLTIMLTPTPAAKAPEPVAASSPQVGPTGAPQIGSAANLAERERNTKEPRREILLSCSGNTRNVLLLLNQEQPERIYQAAEATFYVIAGQGTARVGSLQSTIGAGSFIAVPRGTAFSLTRQGNRPLALVWTLSGEPCEQAR
jgi:mannose-6-phosphate isomerase-like protein (cupin superfamily)